LDPNAPIAQGEEVIVRLRVDPRGMSLDQLVITELLPAGLEIDNPHIAAARQVPWIPRETSHRMDARDDRLLVFTGDVHAPFDLYYTARAVTPGRFIWPGARVEAMYDPSVAGIGAEQACEVTP
jgi:alpha-2-macroglobulin